MVAPSSSSAITVPPKYKGPIGFTLFTWLLPYIEQRPIYEEANRLECCIGIHGGVHDHMGLDDMSPYAPVNALGHPFGQMVNFGGILFNGVFDRYPKVRFGFMEAGSGWFVNCIERFERARKRPVTGQITDQLVRDLAALTGRPLE